MMEWRDLYISSYPTAAIVVTLVIGDESAVVVMSR